MTLAQFTGPGFNLHGVLSDKFISLSGW